MYLIKLTHLYAFLLFMSFVTGAPAENLEEQKEMIFSFSWMHHLFNLRPPGEQ